MINNQQIHEITMEIIKDYMILDKNALCIPGDDYSALVDLYMDLYMITFDQVKDRLVTYETTGMLYKKE